jgi:hypothetical protein
MNTKGYPLLAARGMTLAHTPISVEVFRVEIL